jgi:hypothetical protein
MKESPVRQLPSGAMRASGMLIKPVWPVTLGVSARAADARASAAATSAAATGFKKKAPPRGLVYQNRES